MGDYFISSIFVTVSLFLFVIYNPQFGENSILSKIGRNSLGIYVIHLFLINLVNTFFLILKLEFILESFIWNILYTPTIFFVSYYSYNFIQIVKRKTLCLKLKYNLSTTYNHSIKKKYL